MVGVKLVMRMDGRRNVVVSVPMGRYKFFAVDVPDVRDEIGPGIVPSHVEVLLRHHSQTY